MKNDDLGVPELHGDGGSVYVKICGKDIFLRDFPKMLGIYFQVLMVDKSLHYALENLGDRLYQRYFSPNNLDVPCFVKRVCEWGGYPGIYGRVLKNNTRREIADALNHAADLVYSEDVAGAIATVKTLNGLEASYASKHLRMLCSRECVAYDSVLMGKFAKCYGKSDCYGYAEFCALCVELAKTLNKDYPGIPNAEREGGEWRAADIEAAIFCKYHKKTKRAVATAIKQ